jgi:protein-S-isoprenylcysteine O-methyltransferase Ste14
MSYLILIIIWTVWCTLHSGLISFSVTEYLRKRVPGFFRYYRLFYNSVSFLTLLPILYFTYLLQGPAIFNWSGPWRVLQVVLFGMSVLLFIAGARRYDLAQFLGLRQVHEEKTCSVLTDDCSLDTQGILSIVRHPWYTGGILIVWARPLDLAGILTNIVVCGYFVIGAMLEERKLVLQFGEEYRNYQKRVSMLFPVKWIANSIK